jgi:CRISPR associated protein Cas1
MFDGDCKIGPDEWSSRNDHWISEIRRPSKSRRLRERQKEPLILCGHGVSLRVDGGTLLIRNGLTHYPQQREVYRFFRGEHAIPPRIIMLDGSGSVSFDVLDWLAEQGVTLVRINWLGEVVSVVAGSGFAADPEKLRWQVETRADPEKRIAFATGIIREKIAYSIETLQTTIPAGRPRDAAIWRLRRECNGLSLRTPKSVPDLLGIEGTAAAAYFKAWEGVPLRWKAASGFRPADPRELVHHRSSRRAPRHQGEERTGIASAECHAQLRVRRVAERGADRGRLCRLRPDARDHAQRLQGIAGFRLRHDGAASGEIGCRGPRVRVGGNHQRGGFRPQVEWCGEAGAAVGEKSVSNIKIVGRFS